MKHLSIIIPQGNLILDSIVGTLNLFKMANSYSKRIGKTREDVFAIDLVGITKKPITCHKFFEVKPTNTIDEIKATNLIIISSITGNIEKALEKSGGVKNRAAQLLGLNRTTLVEKLKKKKAA